MSLNPNPICISGGHSYRPMLVGLLQTIERIDGQSISQQDRYDAAELYGFDSQAQHQLQQPIDDSGGDNQV